MNKQDVYRIILTAILIILMCVGYKWALYIIIILSTVAHEVAAYQIKKLKK